MGKGIYIDSKIFRETMGISEGNLDWFKILDDNIIYSEKCLFDINCMLKPSNTLGSMIKSIDLSDFRDKYNKMNNISKNRTPKDNRIKNLKSKNKELQTKLNIANRTIKQQIDNQKELIDENAQLRAENKALNKMEEHYNKHMDIAENEIKRLNQIIFYLETKCMKGFK